MSTDDRFLPQGKQILPKICQVRPMPNSIFKLQKMFWAKIQEHYSAHTTCCPPTHPLPPPPKKKSISSVFSLIDRRWKLPFVEPAPQTPTIRILTSLAYYKTTTWSSTRHNSEKCKYKNYKTVFLNWYINNRWSLTPFYTPLSSCEAMNKMIHKVPVIRNYQSKT